jgi:putative cell wall-binding protein
VNRTPVRRARRLTAILLSAALAAGAAVVATAAPASAASQWLEGRVIPTVATPSSVLSVQVSLHSLDGSGGVAYSVPVGSSGSFSLNANPGRYRIYAEPHRSIHPDLVPTWYGDTPHEAQGAVVEVTDQRIIGLDITLDAGVSISGRITYELGAPNVGAAAAFLFDETTQEFERFSFFARADPTGAYRITGLPPGRYALRFGDPDDQALTSTVYWEDADYLLDSTPVAVADEHLTGYDATLDEGGWWVGRFGGEDRFDTSVQISRTWIFEPTRAVFVANGLNFPDALSAGPAAARLNAPILLTAQDFLPAQVADRLLELDSVESEGAEPLDVIYVVGGEPSVSAAVEAQLEAIAPVVRFEGTDRFDTSRQVAEYFWSESENRTAYLAAGSNFPDALAAAPAAANESAPVILVNGGAPALDAPTAKLLGDLGIRKTVIAGGLPSVSAGIADDVRELPTIQESYRRSGVDRLQTAILTNRASFPFADTVLLATAYGFPDALAGAALAGSVHVPIYLVMPNCIPEGVADEILRLKALDIVLLGGEPTLSSDVKDLYLC